MAYSFFVGLVGPLRMDHSSFHWRAPQDLDRMESWILWQAISLSPPKRPPPPTTRLPGWPQPILPAAGLVASVSTLGGWWGHMECEQYLISGSGTTQDMASDPRNIPPALQNLLPGAPSSWAIRQCKPPTQASDLLSPITMLCLHGILLSLQRSGIFLALKQLCSIREILLTLVKRIKNLLGKIWKKYSMYITILGVWHSGLCRKFLMKLKFWQQKRSQKQHQQQQILPKILHGSSFSLLGNYHLGDYTKSTHKALSLLPVYPPKSNTKYPFYPHHYMGRCSPWLFWASFSISLTKHNCTL